LNNGSIYDIISIDKQTQNKERVMNGNNGEEKQEINGEPTGGQEEAGARSKARSKRTALIILAVIIVLAIVLLLLNSIDFDALAKDIARGNSRGEDVKVTEKSIVTVDPNFLAEPDYDEDILQDAEYLKENRYLHFTYGAETFEVLTRNDSYNNVCTLFYDYFEAVISGDARAYESLFTEEYVASHETPDFTAQKLYNINVKCLYSSYLEDGDANGNYKGYTVWYCDVSYNIKDNNGTFRNDFYGDESTLPLVFEVIEKNGVAKISNVAHYN